MAQRIDLDVVAVDVTQMVTDLQSLEVSGTVQVAVENLGNIDAVSFEIGAREARDRLFCESRPSGVSICRFRPDPSII